MDTATEDILLQKVEELIFDEDQIVTNSILCEKLNICLTEAKLLLEKYVSDELSSGKISVTYLICGKLKTGNYGIQIVDSTLLQEKTKLFDIIGNEIVYSIQKKNNIDFNVIAAAENIGNERKTALKGSIVSEKCRERRLETKILPPLPPQKNVEKQKPASFFKSVSKSEDSIQSKTDQTSLKNNVKTLKVSVTPNNKAGSLSNFLSQSTQKDTKNKSSKDEDNNSKLGGGLSSFLSQTNQKKTKNTNYEDKLNNVKESGVDNEDNKLVSNGKVGEFNEEVIKNGNGIKNLNSEKNEGKVQKKRKERSITDTSSNKVLKKVKEDEGRKRKRIIMDSDSDDDLFGGNEDERMVLEESDEEHNVVKPPPSISVPKNKRRKAVEKTYEDEEGFIVTRTEYVLVSASEDEELDIQRKADIPKPNKTEFKEEKRLSVVPKTASKKKGKALAANQSSITNFFKKK